MKSGIYLITNVVNRKVYVGQSLCVNNRISKHKSYLRSCKHENQYLQRAFDKYGESNFTFSILEYCGVEELDDKEIMYINLFDSMNIEKGYNLESGGNLGKIVSESTREKKRGKNNPRYNVKANEETRHKMIASSRGKNAKLVEQDVIEIKQMLIKGLQQKEIAECFGVNLSTINKIATFKNWGYVRPDLNERYNQLKEEKKAILFKNVRELSEKGYSTREMENILGVDRRMISKVKKAISDNTEITE